MEDITYPMKSKSSCKIFLKYFSQQQEFDLRQKVSFNKKYLCRRSEE